MVVNTYVCVWGGMCVQLSANPWTVAHKAPLSRDFSRQEYWSGLPCPPPGDLPQPGIKPAALSPALAGGFFTTSAAWKDWVASRACVLSRSGRVQPFVVLWTIAHQAHCPWDSPGKYTGVGCHSLLQRIFLTQGWNRVSCIDRGFFATEPHGKPKSIYMLSHSIVSDFATPWTVARQAPLSMGIL